MNKRRISQISDSDDSDGAPHTVEDSISRVLSQSKPQTSESSSESETTLPNPTPQPQRRKVSTTPKQKAQLSPIGRFLSENPELNECDVEDVLSDSDEVFILDAPRTLNAQDFLEKTIKSDKKTKLKLNGKKFVVEPLEEELQAFNLLTTKLLRLYPVNIFKVREYVKQKSNTEFIDSVVLKPALPTNLKVRHPLFGNEYKRKIVLTEEVEKKLDQAIVNEVTKVKKKKKKDKLSRSKGRNEEELNLDSIFNSNYAEESTGLNLEQLISSFTQEPQKVKKKKNKLVKQEYIEEDESFSVGRHNEEGMGSEEHHIKKEGPIASVSQASSKKKKKKKNSQAEMTDTEELNQSEQRRYDTYNESFGDESRYYEEEMGGEEHNIKKERSIASVSQVLNKKKKKKNSQSEMTDTEELNQSEHRGYTNKVTNLSYTYNESFGDEEETGIEAHNIKKERSIAPVSQVSNKKKKKKNSQAKMTDTEELNQSEHRGYTNKVTNLGNTYNESFGDESQYYEEEMRIEERNIKKERSIPPVSPVSNKKKKKKNSQSEMTDTEELNQSEHRGHTNKVTNLSNSYNESFGDESHYYEEEMGNEEGHIKNEGSTVSQVSSKKKKKKKNSQSEMTDTDDLNQSEQREYTSKVTKLSNSFNDDSLGQTHGKKRKHSSLSEGNDNLDFKKSEANEKKLHKHIAKIKVEKDDNLVERAKKEKDSFINSTVIPDLQLPLFEFDVSGIMTKDTIDEESDNSSKAKPIKEKPSINESPKKHKKQIHIKEEPPSDSNSGRVTGKKRKLDPKHKIKLEKSESQDEEQNSLIMNLLKKVKSELGTPSRHKKKQKAESTSDL